MVAVAVKGKSKLSHQVIKEDATKPTKKNNTALGGLPSFKIFAEPPPPSNGGRRLASASGSQSGIKNLEKNNGKKDNSVKANIGRQVLADISNVRGSFSGPKAHSQSKSLCLSRNSVVGTRARACSSRVPLTGIVRNNVTQASVNHHTVNKGKTFAFEKDLNNFLMMSFSCLGSH